MAKTSMVITIGRQYGSGGRVVGQKLAERLEIPFYDKCPDIIFFNEDLKHFPFQLLEFSVPVGRFSESCDPGSFRNRNTFDSAIIK